MYSRRNVLLSILGLSLLPHVSAVVAQGGIVPGDSLVFRDFLKDLEALAVDAQAGKASEHDVVRRGLDVMQRLNVDEPSFAAVVTKSFESGNAFWLWQRLHKAPEINGGILTISPSRVVQLHDHPRAIGMVRILSGQAEVWQYDRLPSESSMGQNAVLERVSHKVLRPGDVAVLTPHTGNIHALHAKGGECRMLDFFVPPYVRSKRTWYEPIDHDWPNRELITCRAIKEHDFMGA